MNKFKIPIKEPQAEPGMEVKGAEGMLIKDHDTNEPMAKVYDYEVNEAEIVWYVETGIDDPEVFKRTDLTGEYYLFKG